MTHVIQKRNDLLLNVDQKFTFLLHNNNEEQLFISKIKLPDFYAHKKDYDLIVIVGMNI